MPDGRTWFAQNLNYTKDLTFNAYAREANGKVLISASGVLAIGSYWCPGVQGSTYSGDQNMCNIYGALYAWQTAMMVDGKYADESKTSSAWDESWISPYYYTGAPNSSPHADRNNARGGTNVKGGGRGICPMGWHIPTQLEWAIMLDACDGDGSGTEFVNSVVGDDAAIGNDAGKKLKSAYSCPAELNPPGCWFPSSLENKGSDAYGFSALPAGMRHDLSPWSMGEGRLSAWYSSSLPESFRTPMYYVHSTIANLHAYLGYSGYGYNIRCLRDQ
jgi:uncharacterized protein (TIGR02145 family)